MRPDTDYGQVILGRVKFLEGALADLDHQRGTRGLHRNLFPECGDDAWARTRKIRDERSRILDELQRWRGKAVEMGYAFGQLGVDLRLVD